MKSLMLPIEIDLAISVTTQMKTKLRTPSEDHRFYEKNPICYSYCLMGILVSVGLVRIKLVVHANVACGGCKKEQGGDENFFDH